MYVEISLPVFDLVSADMYTVVDVIIAISAAQFSKPPVLYGELCSSCNSVDILQQLHVLMFTYVISYLCYICFTGSALTGTADSEFCMIPNVLMLAAGIMNACRTGDLCNMTLSSLTLVSRELVTRIT